MRSKWSIGAGWTLEIGSELAVHMVEEEEIEFGWMEMELEGLVEIDLEIRHGWARNGDLGGE